MKMHSKHSFVYRDYVGFEIIPDYTGRFHCSLYPYILKSLKTVFMLTEYSYYLYSYQLYSTVYRSSVKFE